MTISDYLSQLFGMKIGEIITCFPCHQNKATRILKYNYLIMSLEVMKFNIKQTPIFHDKMTHLVINFVTMKELLDEFNEKQI